MCFGLSIAPPAIRIDMKKTPAHMMMSDGIAGVGSLISCHHVFSTVTIVFPTIVGATTNCRISFLSFTIIFLPGSSLFCCFQTPQALFGFDVVIVFVLELLVSVVARLYFFFEPLGLYFSS